MCSSCFQLAGSLAQSWINFLETLEVFFLWISNSYLDYVRDLDPVFIEIVLELNKLVMGA